MTVFDVSQLFANLTFLYVLIGLENLCSQKYVDGKSICLARNEEWFVSDLITLSYTISKKVLYADFKISLYDLIQMKIIL